MNVNALIILFGMSGLLLCFTIIILYNSGIRCKNWKIYTVDPNFIEQYLSLQRAYRGIETVNRDITIFGMRRFMICIVLIIFIMFFMVFFAAIITLLEIKGFI